MRTKEPDSRRSRGGYLVMEMTGKVLRASILLPALE